MFGSTKHTISVHWLQRALMQQQQQQKQYRNPALAVDAVVLRCNNATVLPAISAGRDEVLQHLHLFDLLLITRKHEPFKNCFAFPGGFVDYGEDPQNAVIRELEEETSLHGLQESVQLVSVLGSPTRDPRKHVVSIAYAVKVPDIGQLKAADDAATAHWINLAQLHQAKHPLAFDHQQLVAQTVSWFADKGFKDAIFAKA